MLWALIVNKIWRLRNATIIHGSASDLLHAWLDCSTSTAFIIQVYTNQLPCILSSWRTRAYVSLQLINFDWSFLNQSLKCYYLFWVQQLGKSQDLHAGQYGS